MRKMKYSALMKKVDEGDAEINAWATKPYTNEPDVADVTFHTMRSSKRERIEVTNIPE